MTGDLYAGMLMRVLGKDAVAVVPATGEDRQEWRSPDWRRILPTSWAIEELPADPRQFLDAAKEQAQAAESKPVFVAAPWIRWRQLPPDLREETARLALHEHALLVVRDHVSEGTLVGSLLPYQAVTGNVSREFRRRLFSGANLVAVLTHDPLARLIDLHAAFATVTLVFSSGGQTPTRFFRVPDHEEDDEVLADLDRLLSRSGGETRYGYVLREPLPPESSLSHDLRAPELTRGKAVLAELGELRHLEALFETHRGLSPGDRNLVAEDGEGVLVVRARDITSNGIDVTGITQRAIAPPERWLRPGDLLVRAVTPGSGGRLVVAEVPPSIEPAVAAWSVITLRPRAELGDDDRRFVRAYLASPFAMRVAAALGTGGPHLRPQSLSRMLVPVPDEDLRVALRDLEDAAVQLRSWQQEADNTLASLFGARQAGESRAAVLHAGARVRERVRAGRRIDELGFRVRSMFPHPIAYRWRAVEAARPDLEGYKQVLETAEVAITYASTLALVTAVALDERVGYVDQIRQRLTERRDAGITLGDWLSMFREVRDGRAFARIADRAPIPELFSLWGDEEANSALRRLVDRRNDEAHLRGPAGSDVAPAVEEARSDLELLLEQAELFGDYPLRLIEAISWRELDQATEYDYRDLRGDHPLVPLERGRASTHRLESSNLYLATRSGELHRVTPFLVHESCPECGRPSTFSLDRLRDGTPLLKALEHGHTLERPELRSEFEAVGLL